MKNPIPIAALMGVTGVAGLLLVGTWVSSAQAAVTEAYVNLGNCGTHEFTDPLGASGAVTTTTCGSIITGPVLTEGAALFGDSISLSLNLTSQPGRGVSGRAYLDDEVTFHIAGGGSAVVPVRIAGRFNGTGFPTFSVTLGLGNYFHEYIGSLTDSIDGNPNTDCCFPQTGDPASPAGAFGSYAIAYDWSITDGGVYGVFSALKAEAGDGSSIYIDDPLTFQLPDGVTFTSASNSTYTSPVPLPATVWLLGTGIAGLSGRRWLRRKISG